MEGENHDHIFKVGSYGESENGDANFVQNHDDQENDTDDEAMIEASEMSFSPSGHWPRSYRYISLSLSFLLSL